MVVCNRLVLAAAGLTLGVCALGAWAVGPDVVTSEIGSSFAKYGTKNLGTAQSPVYVTGYAVTTESCNIGTDYAVWYDFTATDNDDGQLHHANEHPVIGTQLYRLHSGRFEQLGMSWLKHGFCAQDSPSCTSLGPPGTTAGSLTPRGATCQWLQRWYTDTYGAGLNADQPSCGPRSEVNASTGVFQYPYGLNWALSGDCAYKRLQVLNSDLAPANFPAARYFVEVHYVTSDENSVNRLNNASYHEAVVGSLSNGLTSGGCTSTVQGYGMSFTGATVALKPAIEAWRTADATVALTTVDVAGDGRIFVGSKATNLGNGTYQYEYAVYNHNSDRSVGGFSIPKSASAAATFTNIGFHDVPYHSGEPFDGTDWPATVSTSALRWATTPYATNPNANAIRWSTLYNFRFVSNQTPTTGSVTLELFKPGSGPSVSAAGVWIPSVPVSLCPGDFNQSGGPPSVQDVFDFLSAYFSGLVTADFNHVDGVTVQDIFDFLIAYFTPCP